MYINSRSAISQAKAIAQLKEASSSIAKGICSTDETATVSSNSDGSSRMSNIRRHKPTITKYAVPRSKPTNRKPIITRNLLRSESMSALGLKPSFGEGRKPIVTKNVVPTFSSSQGATASKNWTLNNRAAAYRYAEEYAIRKQNRKKAREANKTAMDLHSRKLPSKGNSSRSLTLDRDDADPKRDNTVKSTSKRLLLSGEKKAMLLCNIHDVIDKLIEKDEQLDEFCIKYDFHESKEESDSTDMLKELAQITELRHKVLEAMEDLESMLPIVEQGSEAMGLDLKLQGYRELSEGEVFFEANEW